VPVEAAANVPSVTESDAFWVDVAFFLEKTPARRAAISRMAKALNLPMPQGSRGHVLGASFGSPEQGPHVNLHIDHSQYDKDPVNYYVRLHIHGGEAHEHDHEEDESKQTVTWLYEQLANVAKSQTALFGFVEAHLQLDDWPIPSQAITALPITVGGRVLPVIGMSYGTDLDEGVDMFRWTRDEGGIRVDVSYTSRFNVNEISDLWQREHATVMAYVREVFPR
jgi:hypothetical protein